MPMQVAASRPLTQGRVAALLRGQLAAVMLSSQVLLCLAQALRVTRLSQVWGSAGRY